MYIHVHFYFNESSRRYQHMAEEISHKLIRLISQKYWIAKQKP